MGTLLSLYDMPATWNEAIDSPLIAQWQPPVMVVMNPNRERVARLHALCPKALIELRDQPLSEQHEALHRDPIGTGRRHAQEMHALRMRVAPDIAADQILLARMNEMDANPADFGGQAVQHIVDYAVASFDESARLGDRASGPAFGVCWPFFGQWTPYLPIREAARRGHHVVTCHRYFRLDLGLDHEYAQWAGELGDWDDVELLVEECGDDGLLMGRKGKQPSGWHDVDPEAKVYPEALFEFDRRLRRRRNVIGACVFCKGSSDPWESYNVDPILPRIAQYAEQERARPAPTAFSQRDPRWAGTPLGTGGGRTIGQAGCLISSIASALNDLTDCRYTPLSLNAWLCSHGGYADGNDFVWQSVGQLGLGYLWTSYCRKAAAPVAAIREALADGQAVIAWVDPDLSTAEVEQHWVRVVGVDEDGHDADIVDPWQPAGQEISRLSEHYEAAGWDVARALFQVVFYGRPS